MRTPELFGVNATVKVVVAPIAILSGKVNPEPITNSDELEFIPLMVKTAVPSFLIV